MKLKKVMMVSLILLAILTIGAVSASDVADNLAVSDSSQDAVDASFDDEKLSDDVDVFYVHSDEEIRLDGDEEYNRTMDFGGVGLPYDTHSGAMVVSVKDKVLCYIPVNRPDENHWFVNEENHFLHGFLCLSDINFTGVCDGDILKFSYTLDDRHTQYHIITMKDKTFSLEHTPEGYYGIHVDDNFIFNTKNDVIAEITLPYASQGTFVIYQWGHRIYQNTIGVGDGWYSETNGNLKCIVYDDGLGYNFDENKSFGYQEQSYQFLSFVFLDGQGNEVEEYTVALRLIDEDESWYEDLGPKTPLVFNRNAISTVGDSKYNSSTCVFGIIDDEYIIGRIVFSTSDGKILINESVPKKSKKWGIIGWDGASIYRIYLDSLDVSDFKNGDTFKLEFYKDDDTERPIYTRSLSVELNNESIKFTDINGGKINSYVYFNYDADFVYQQTSTLQVGLFDEIGNPISGEIVQITFGKKVYERKTNSKGIATLSLSLDPGYYDAYVDYPENDVYFGSGDSFTDILVSKATPKITASSKTFSVKTKTKSYAIVLKDSKGKAIKKVSVTIKVNGKTYKATTTSAGKATFKITKLTKKGKFTATIKFAGNKYFKAIKKSVKIITK